MDGKSNFANAHCKILLAAALSFLGARALASDANLLPAGDFATPEEINDWPVSLSPAPVGVISWSTDDADASPASGSMEIITSGDGVVSECFRVTPGAAFMFNGMSKSVNAYATSNALFACDEFSDVACGVRIGSLGRASFPLAIGAATSWSATPMVAGSLSATALSAQCVVLLGDTATIDVRFDNLVFISADPPIFKDGFEGP